MPQTASEGVTLLTPNQSLISVTLPPLHDQTLFPATVKADGQAPLPIQRPLYLALSCWLI